MDKNSLNLSEAMDKLGFGGVFPSSDDGTVLYLLQSDSDLDGDCNVSVGIESNTSADESRRLSIKRSIQSLVHASDCQHADCAMPECYKMKRVIHHVEGCKTKCICLVCKQFIALCCYHAKHCQQNKCPVRYCVNIKHKLRQQLLERQTSTATTISSTATPQTSAQIEAIEAQVNSLSLNLRQ